MNDGDEGDLRAVYRQIVELSGVARDALVASYGTGMGSETGTPVQWWLIRKSGNDAPRGEQRRIRHTWWALTQCLQTGRFHSVVARDVHEADRKLAALVRWPAPSLENRATT